MKPVMFMVVLSLLFLFSCKQKHQQSTYLLPFYTTADFTPQFLQPPSADKATLHTIPPFSFTDQSGANITEQTFENKIYVANFFFTSCPGICKKLTDGLAIVQLAYKNDDDVLLLSHSVTPEKDSVKRLQQYATDHNVVAGKWHLVTGDRKAIYNIARLSYFADEEIGVPKNEDDFLHTENILLIDRHRRIRGVYKGTDAAEIKNLIADISTLKKETK